jgi:hypothetical protein
MVPLISFKPEETIMRKRQFSRSLSVALSEEHFELIKQITDEEQISMAEWVRNAVAETLNNCKREEVQQNDDFNEK